MPTFTNSPHSGKRISMVPAEVKETRITYVVANGIRRDTLQEVLCAFSIWYKSEEMRDARNKLANFVCIFFGGFAEVYRIFKLCYLRKSIHYKCII